MPKTVMGLCQPQYWWRMVSLCVCVCVCVCGDNRKITPATKGCHLADRIVCHLTSPILNHTISTNLPFIILTLAVASVQPPRLRERERERQREWPPQQPSPAPWSAHRLLAGCQWQAYGHFPTWGSLFLAWKPVEEDVLKQWQHTRWSSSLLMVRRSLHAPMTSTSLTMLRRQKRLTSPTHAGLAHALHVLARLWRGLWISLMLASLMMTR